MKKRIVGLLICGLLLGCDSEYVCHGLIPLKPAPDPDTFHTSSELHLGFYQDMAHGWEVNQELEEKVDLYFKEALTCAAEKLHGTISVEVRAAEPIGDMDTFASIGEPSSEIVEAGTTPFPRYTGVLPSDFRIVLTHPHVCIEKPYVNGITGGYEGHLFVWVNNPDYPDLFRHEFLHVLDAVLNLTDEQEKSLYPCTPKAPHGGNV